MPPRKREESEEGKPAPRSRLSSNPHTREAQLISLAEKQAERLMRSGDAPAQIVTHYLKLGSTREELEQERLREEIALLRSKNEQLQQGQRIEALYEEALAAMNVYKGNTPPPSNEYDRDEY